MAGLHDERLSGSRTVHLQELQKQMNQATKTHSRSLTSSDTFLAIDDAVFSVRENASKCLCEATKSGEGPVIRNTPEGPDAFRAHVLGACHAEGKFQMWYLANDARGRWHTCYAESQDGYNWIKPELGLIEYDGSKRNNIILHKETGDFTITNVYRDADDPDPARRYKAPVYGNITQDYFTNEEDRKRYAGASHPCIKTFAYSADGIHWVYDQEVDFPVPKKIESGALFKKNDKWFMVHQMICGEYPQVCSGCRYLGVSSSKDLQNWELSDEPGFYFDLGGNYRKTIQTHITPAILDYGNVTVGVVGMFYGHQELYKEETDLALILSNDGYHWRQPIEGQPFSTILRRGDAGRWDHSFPVQGGLVNTSDKTFVYYSASDRYGNLGYVNRQVGMAELPRDRFGYLVPSVGWGYQSSESSTATLVTHPILITQKGLSLCVNAQGASRPCDSLKVELLDESDNPIPGYTAADCVNITQDGLDVPVRWVDRDSLDPLAGQRIKLRIELVGRNEQHEILACTEYPKLFAFYFRDKAQTQFPFDD